MLNLLQNLLVLNQVKNQKKPKSLSFGFVIFNVNQIINTNQKNSKIKSK